MAFDLWKHKDLKSRLRKRSSGRNEILRGSLETKSEGARQSSITSFIQMEDSVASELLDCNEPPPSSSRGSPKDGDVNNASHSPCVPSSKPVQIILQRQTKLTTFFTCSDELASRAKSPEEESRSKKVLPQFAGRKSSRKCPFYKFIPGTPCVVDAFMYGYLPEVEMYFLTHFHSDHYSGLNRRFSMPIYCSKVTASLVNLKLKVDKRFLHVLELNQWSILPDGTAVMPIDANHCPGAVMFIFKMKNGEDILHTGDFRAEEVVVQNPVWEQVRIGLLFLDTTYCDPAYVFPEQREVISEALDFIRAKMKIHSKLLIAVGAYAIGKERLFAAIAEAFDCKICVEKSKMQVLNCLEDVNLRARLTIQKTETFLHVMPMANISKNKLAQYLKIYPSYKHILGILPTGWQFRSGWCSAFEETDAVTLLGVPYSEHSSYLELKRFVQRIRPKRIIPTVNASNEEARFLMARTFSQWMEER